MLTALINANRQVSFIPKLKFKSLFSADCLLFALWSGNFVKGEIAVTTFNASTLREVGNVQSTTFKKAKFRECFVARKVIYCIG